MAFFIPFPFTNWGNGLFQFPSLSRTSGMELSIPVPELPNVIPAHPWYREYISFMQLMDNFGNIVTSLENILLYIAVVTYENKSKDSQDTFVHCCHKLRKESKRFSLSVNWWCSEPAITWSNKNIGRSQFLECQVNTTNHGMLGSISAIPDD